MKRYLSLLLLLCISLSILCACSGDKNTLPTHLQQNATPMQETTKITDTTTFVTTEPTLASIYNENYGYSTLEQYPTKWVQVSDFDKTNGEYILTNEFSTFTDAGEPLSTPETFFNVGFEEFENGYYTNGYLSMDENNTDTPIASYNNTAYKWEKVNNNMALVGESTASIKDRYISNNMLILEVSSSSGSNYHVIPFDLLDWNHYELIYVDSTKFYETMQNTFVCKIYLK